MSVGGWRLASVALASTWLSSSLVAGEGGGAFECPCLNASSSAFAALQDELVAQGRSASYGAEGCKAYDENGAEYGCDADPAPPFCSTLWCYVDMSLCPINKELCEEAGSIVGSDLSPHCRSRPSRPSSVLPSGSHYSYETCNNLNKYTIEEPVTGTIVKVVVDVWPPYVVERTRASGKTELGGVIWDFFEGLMQSIEPETPRVNVVDGWATEASMALLPSSSYTACAHDVGVGNFDICIGDVWHTAEREQLVQFSPPLRHDYFYVITKMKVFRDTWAHRLERPFAPFTPSTWLAVLGFLVGMWVLLWLLKLHSKSCADFKVHSRASFGTCLESGVEVFDDFLHRSSTSGVNTCPAKMFRLGFQFFLLVFSCSYTASLASLLVVQRQQEGQIESLADAIEKRVPVCAPSAVLQSLQTMYPLAVLVDIGDVGYGAKFLHSGKCEAWIGAKDDVDRLHAGYYQDRDCQELADGLVTEQEAFCSTDASGQPRNDCNLDRVGDIVLTVPVAFPLSQRVARSLSFSIINYMDKGGWNEALRLNADVFPVSRCKGEVKDPKVEGLDLEDLAGTLVITVIVVGLGVVFMVLQSIVNLLRPKKGDSGKTIIGDAGGKTTTGAALAAVGDDNGSHID